MVIYMELMLIMSLALFMKEKNFKKIGIPILLMTIIIIVGSRNILGLDDNSYKQIFYYIKNGKMWAVGNLEITYVLLTKFLIFFNFNYKMLFLIYAFLTYFFIFLSIKKLDLNKIEFILFFLSYFLICFISNLTIMRQALAMAIIFYASCLMREGKIKTSIMYTIISGFFHNTAWLCLPVMIIFHEKIKINKTIKILLPISCFILSDTGIIIGVAKFFNNLFNLHYMHYLEYNETKFVGKGIFVLARFLIYLFQFLFTQKDKRDDFFEKGQMIWYALFFATENVGYMRRFSHYFIIYETFLLVALINKLANEKQQKLVYYVAMTILVILNIYLFNKVKLAGEFGFDNFSFKFIG